MPSEYYTRKGDDGTTRILGKNRVTKDHPRPEAVGSVDEANAALGMARAICQAPRSPEILLTAQRDLYHLMAEAAASSENAPR
jgi:cob(I)alamin adenosyltransferase